jgi:hypothetical protein
MFSSNFDFEFQYLIEKWRSLLGFLSKFNEFCVSILFTNLCFIAFEFILNLLISHAEKLEQKSLTLSYDSMKTQIDVSISQSSLLNNFLLAFIL